MNYSDELKRKAINEAILINNTASTARCFGVPESTLINWLKMANLNTTGSPVGKGRKPYPSEIRSKIIDDILAGCEITASASLKYSIARPTITRWLIFYRKKGVKTRARKIYSEEFKNFVLNELEGGKTVSNICQNYNISKVSVRRWRKDKELKITSRQIDLKQFQNVTPLRSLWIYLLKLKVLEVQSFFFNQSIN